MARRLRPVGLDFVETAPVRLVFAREIEAAPEAVFRALADDVPGWAEWFAAVTLARPLDGGARREVRLKGGTRFEETVLAAKEAELYAYRVDVTNAPGMRALAEEWRLAPAGTGTRVRWTFAADGSAPMRLVLRAARAGLGRSFRDATAALDRRIAS
ncbi:SRPBCC family protein [Streptomyces sp. NPDC101225]|uniref:SRPBCC family protein n=1 Tax=Streptomyces sp. NPDC101225 TaxID=3366135 RepID=UPI00381B0656